MDNGKNEHPHRSQRGSHPKSYKRALLKLDLERFITFGFISSHPQRQLIIGYLSYALIGTALLLLPFSTYKDATVIDHLFTSVSALSTTGLSTVDVATTYTFWGELVILLLIQIGGLGYMTMSSFAMYKLTHHLWKDKARIFKSQFSFPEGMQASGMVGNIMTFTVIFELLGFLLLYPYFLFNDVEQPLWSAVFHSVSAFCTAGFSIYSDNLMQFETDYFVNIVIMVLSYMGAMGFIVMTDLWRKIRKRGYRITFTTKVIIFITLIMSLWGTLNMFFFEPSLSRLPVSDRLLVSVFQSMSAMTTVGYNTVDVGTLAPITLLVLTFIMYVGASPSGTGGGLKSTTFSAIIAYTKNKLGLRKDISLFGNKIPDYRVETAITTFIFYSSILISGIYVISLIEPATTDFLDIVFESASALATAGLSSGILSYIKDGSKIVLIILMFIGRIGVLTLGNVMLIRAIKNKPIKDNDLVV